MKFKVGEDFLLIFYIVLQTTFGSPPLCDLSNTGWWCAVSYPAGQTVTSAVNSDSCFCIGFTTNITAGSAGTQCGAIGGTLTDIRNSAENTLIGNLITQASSQQPSSPRYPLFIGLQRIGVNYTWQYGCDTAVPTYTNYNQTSESQGGFAFTYTYSSDMTWTANNDPVNGTANGFVCRLDRQPCGRINCTSPQTCAVIQHCAYCQSPTTTSASTTTTTTLPGVSSPVPFCNPSIPGQGWWCAVDYPLGQSVATAVSTDSCFCYMYQNMTQVQAQQSCAAIGGYLSDIRSSTENDLLQQLVAIVQLSAPQVQLTCDPGWQYYNGSCYIISATKTNFRNAENYCWNTYGMHLVSVHSLGEYNFLNNYGKNFSPALGTYGMWTGGNDLTNGIWQWTDGSLWDYTPPAGVCGIINTLMGFVPGIHYKAISPSLPCCHSHYDDSLNIACKKTPTLLPMWIGLEHGSTFAWDRGCEIKQNTGYNYTSGTTMTPAGYIYNLTKTWVAQNPTTYVAPGAMCRKDRRPCGNNNCTTTQTCVNIGNCFYCVNQTTTTTTTSTTSTTSTSRSTSTTSTSSTSTSTTTTTIPITSTSSTSTTATTTPSASTSTSSMPATTTTTPTISNSTLSTSAITTTTPTVFTSTSLMPATTTTTPIIFTSTSSTSAITTTSPTASTSTSSMLTTTTTTPIIFTSTSSTSAITTTSPTASTSTSSMLTTTTTTPSASTSTTLTSMSQPLTLTIMTTSSNTSTSSTSALPLNTTTVASMSTTTTPVPINSTLAVSVLTSEPSTSIVMPTTLLLTTLTSVSQPSALTGNTTIAPITSTLISSVATTSIFQITTSFPSKL